LNRTEEEREVLVSAQRWNVDECRGEEVQRRTMAMMLERGRSGRAFIGGERGPL